MDYSRLVKGLIYISPAVFGDSKINPSHNNNNNSRFEDLKSDSYIAEIFANLHATGFIRLTEQLGITTLEELLKDYANFSILSKDFKDLLLSSLRSGTYFYSQVRENNQYLLSDFQTKSISRDLQKKKIGKSVIIIEGSKAGIEPVLNWFPKERFLQFSSNIVLTVNGATLNSLLMYTDHIKTTAAFINDNLV